MKKNIDLSRMVCTFSLNIMMHLLKKSHQKGWIQSECKASLSLNICFCTKRRWTAQNKYTATGPSIKNLNKHLLKSRSHSQSTQLTKESTKDSRTPPLEKWSMPMTIRYLLSLFRKTIGSEIKMLFGQEHFFFRFKKTNRSYLRLGAWHYLIQPTQSESKGPFTQAIFVAATRCNFCRAKVAASKSRV